MNRGIVGAAVAALCFGLMAGGSLVYEMMPAREPRPCEIARELSDDYIYAQADLLNDVSARERAIGTPEWQDHDDAVTANLKELHDIAAPYREAYNGCKDARS